MITSRGETKLLDFGIAKAIPLERSVEAEAETQTWLTRPGIFSEPRCMPPLSNYENRQLMPVAIYSVLVYAPSDC